MCYNNKITDLNVGQNLILNDLYCDDYLFIENKIKGIENSALIRLDIRQEKLIKNQDPKYI